MNSTMHGTTECLCSIEGGRANDVSSRQMFASQDEFLGLMFMHLTQQLCAVDHRLRLSWEHSPLR